MQIQNPQNKFQGQVWPVWPGEASLGWRKQNRPICEIYNYTKLSCTIWYILETKKSNVQTQVFYQMATKTMQDN